jgi:hypothetical protein
LFFIELLNFCISELERGLSNFVYDFVPSSHVKDFKIFAGKVLVRFLLSIGALLMGAASFAWPYIVEFFQFMHNKWEVLTKSMGE